MREVCGTPIMAVVKADGFGLGAIRVARAAVSGGATELGVATIDEALTLRAASLEEPILAWMLHDGARVGEALDAKIRLSLTRRAQVAEVARLAAGLGVVAEIELEVETGMHRSGCSEADWDATLDEARRAEASGWVRVIGVWTHLSGCSPAHFTEPLETLGRAADLARRKGLRPRVHAAASLAATIDPRTRLDLVRLGASLVGIEPVRADPVGLHPAIRWESHITQLHDVREGALVGYGRHRIDSPRRLALIPVGYADGVPRRASPTLGVLTRTGHKLPFIGTISMDHAVVDIGDLEVSPGEAVVLIGDPLRGEPGLADWADALDTIEQEILTGLGDRVARVESTSAWPA
ncbi:hypothetical protein ASD93_15045 [Microbacterium sp. Root180]|nr:hypothetical protein ASD93_15045 [Microbacterium sp. Root180]